MDGGFAASAAARAHRARRVATAGATGLLVWCCAGAAAAQPDEAGEHRSEEVAGWELLQPPIDPTPEPHAEEDGASMERRTEHYRIRYEVHGGIERTVHVQRLNCGEATNADGGAMYNLPIYPTGSTADTAGAVRAAAREADASFDEYCPPRRAALEAALAGLETALDTLEGWVRERPLPAVAAWSRGFWAVERTEPPVTIRFSRDPGGEAERLLMVDVECNGILFGERETLPPPVRPEDRRRAVAALADLLARVNAHCPVAAERQARLAEGFEEALALSAAEEE